LTFPTAINPAGAIVGASYDANGVQHGFLRLPKRALEPPPAG